MAGVTRAVNAPATVLHYVFDDRKCWNCATQLAGARFAGTIRAFENLCRLSLGMAGPLSITLNSTPQSLDGSRPLSRDSGLTCRARSGLYPAVTAGNILDGVHFDVAGHRHIKDAILKALVL